MEVPHHVTLSLTQGEGNHTLPCFPSHTEHFLFFSVLIVCVRISKLTVYSQNRRCWETESQSRWNFLTMLSWRTRGNTVCVSQMSTARTLSYRNSNFRGLVTRANFIFTLEFLDYAVVLSLILCTCHPVCKKWMQSKALWGYFEDTQVLWRH